MIAAGRAADLWSSWVAETVAALFTWGLLLTAAVLVGYGLHRWGFERGWHHRDLQARRERVAQAWADAAAETVDIGELVPTQRGESE